MEKARFIPAGAVKVSAKDSDAVAYLLIDKLGRPVAHVYVGKQSKPVRRCYYRSLESREADVRKVFAWRAEWQAAKVAAREAKAAWKNPYKVGDIFDSSWGYDQTNVDFFECVGVKGKMLEIRKIHGASSQDNVPVECGKIVPLPGAFVPDNGYGGGVYRVLAQDGGFKSPIHGFARFMEPKVIAGVKTYGAQYWSAYA